MTDKSKLGEILRGHLDNPEQDRLGRMDLVRRITDLVCLPATDEQAVRVGLYGAWGEGKTSVLRLVEHEARRRGHAVARLEAWRAHSEEHFWEMVIDTIDDALHAREPRSAWRGVEPIRPVRLWRWIKSRFSTLGSAAGDTKLISDATTTRGTVPAGPTSFIFTAGGLPLQVVVLGALLKHLLSLLSEPREHARLRRRTALVDIGLRRAEKRVILLIDELDRTKPALVAPIMLGLRQLLDHPLLSFVIAFDEEMVEDALATSTARWGEPHRFIEKVIDFPVHLPDVAPSLAFDLLEHMRVGSLSELARGALWANRDVLPTNPRRLRLLARHLRLALDHANHAGVDWNQRELILVQIIKTLSVDLARFVFSDAAFKKAMQGAAVAPRADNEAAWKKARMRARKLGRVHLKDADWADLVLQRLKDSAFHLRDLKLMCFSGESGVLVGRATVERFVRDGFPIFEPEARAAGASLRAYVADLLDAFLEAIKEALSSVPDETLFTASEQRAEAARALIARAAELWASATDESIGDLTHVAMEYVKEAARWEEWTGTPELEACRAAEGDMFEKMFASSRVEPVHIRPRKSRFHERVEAVLVTRYVEELWAWLPSLHDMKFPLERRAIFTLFLLDVEGPFWTRRRRDIETFIGARQRDSQTVPLVHWVETAIEAHADGDGRGFLETPEFRALWTAAVSHPLRLAYFNAMKKVRDVVLADTGKLLPVPAWFEKEASKPAPDAAPDT